MNTKDLIEAAKFQVSVKPQDEFMAEVAERLETLYEENNRQKAEIKKLQTYITNHPYRIVMGTADIYTENHEEYEKLLAKISAEAVKEFAERLKEKIYVARFYASTKKEFSVSTIDPDEIDNLVKEMVGDKE